MNTEAFHRIDGKRGKPIPRKAGVQAWETRKPQSQSS